jgi:hypothetical protein
MNPEVKTMSDLCKVHGSGPNDRQPPSQEAPAVSFDSGPVEPSWFAEVATSTPTRFSG